MKQVWNYTSQIMSIYYLTTEAMDYVHYMLYDFQDWSIHVHAIITQV